MFKSRVTTMKGKGIVPKIGLVVVTVFAVLWGAPSRGSTITDAWNVHQGGTVLGSSTLLSGSDARDAIGSAYSRVEPGCLLFVDDLPKGTIHWLEWQAPTPIGLIGIDLAAGCDGPPNYPRMFDHVTFKAYNNGTGQYQTIYDADIAPYSVLNLNITLPSAITAQKFRGEFRQYAGSGYNMYGGPRIWEIDAVVPEPATMALLGLGVAGLVARRIRRK